MKPVGFQSGYLGGPAPGWEPSKLGCMAEHLLGARLDAETSLPSGCPSGAGTYAASKTAFPVLFQEVIFSLIVCGHILDFLKEIAPRVAMYLVPLRELGSLFLSLMEVLYDYPVVYLMSVLALCPSLLETFWIWSCYATHCIRSPIGSNIVFSAFFFNLKCPPSQAHELT